MSQMDAVSAAFVAALDGSMEYVATVDVWADGSLVKAGLEITAGDVSVTAGQAIRSRVTLTMADPDGTLRPTGLDSTLSPYGPELNIKAGLRLSDSTEMVSVGWFPIVSVDVDQTWRAYRSADDLTLIPSGTVSVEAVDRMQWVREAAFEARESPKKTTVLAEIARLLQGIAPWQPPDGVTDRDIPTGVSYSSDRLDTITMLADSLDMDPIVNVSGSVTLATRTQGLPVWDVVGGDEGVLTHWQRKLVRDGTFNAAVVYGQDPQYGLAPKVGRAYQQDGPLRYRQGLKIPYIQSSPILTTQDQVDHTSQTTLARVVSLNAQAVDVECSPNPALEVGDTVTLQAPRGTVPARIDRINLPLTPARMKLSCSVDPVLLGQVA